jgi:hypothetical protein
MGHFNHRLLSILIAVGGCVVGSYSAFAAFANGQLIADGVAATIFGVAFAAVVVISWIMLPVADLRFDEGARRDAWLWRGSWLLALGFVLANSIVFSAHYRTEVTEVKGLQIEAYERAQRAETLAAAELQSLRTNTRWEATSGCSNVTAPKSKAYCERVHDTQSRIESAQTILVHGRPVANDAGAQTLAWVLGGDEAKVGRSLPIFWAVVLELMASLCMKNAFSSLRPSKTTTRYPATNKGNDVTSPLQNVQNQFASLFPQAGYQAMQLKSFKAFNDNMPEHQAA